ncbi:MAG: S-adenosylmethionine hydrolase, partial [Bacteroidia bacterium]
MITLLTDFGSDSFQTVRSRTWLALNCPEEKVLDISHSIHANDINEAAYIFRLVLDQFQTDTVHILAIDFDQRAKNPEVIYFKYKGQHILTYNSGMASILLEQQTNEVVTVGNYTSNHYDSVISCFGEKAKQLLLGQLSDQKSLIPDQLNIKTVLNPVSSEKMLHGHVVYFDALGTCYTNISQNEFEAFVDGVAF